MTMSTTQSPRKPWQKSQKGQVLLIFALSALVLFAIMGLAVDAGISYLHSDQQEKAAAAAALSGVGYLPGDFTNGALPEATLTAQRNGYTSGGSGVHAVTVSVFQPTGTINELEVQITAPAPVYFLELLGFGTHEVTSTAIAEYLPPIQLGQPGSQLGTTLSGLGTSGEYFLRTEGWGNPRHEGDAFTPTPDNSDDSCGPTLASCQANPADVHQISCIDGTDLCNGVGSSNTDCGSTTNNGGKNLCLNDVGGSSFLIYVPATTLASVSIFNPSFDPGVDSDCGSQVPTCLDTYHEDDGSFPVPTSWTTAEAISDYSYDAMGYTLYAVPDLNNRSNDIPLEQDIFCPFNAYDLDTGVQEYSYYEEGNSGAACNPVDSGQAGSLQTVTSGHGFTLPTAYNAPPAGEAADGNSYTPVSSAGNPGWISLNNPSIAPAALFDQTYNVMSSESAYTNGTQYLYGGSAGQYFRLRVDTLAWNGMPISSSCSYPEPDTGCPTTNSDGGSVNTSSDPYPTGHNGYSVDVTTSSCGSCSNCSVSGMADMTIYTPINGATDTNGGFPMPLFSLPAAYAGKTITVNIFNPGVGGGGNAYVGILQPGYTSGSTTYPTQFASLAKSVTDLGTSLGAGGATTVAVNCGPNLQGYTCGTSAASIQTGTTACIPGISPCENYSGDAIYRGSWLEFNIAVPNNYNPSSTTNSFWDLYYQVSSTAYAGNTITVEVQYLGSPVHLLQG
jgi:hypothetical protein